MRLRCATSEEDRRTSRAGMERFGGDTRAGRDEGVPGCARVGECRVMTRRSAAQHLTEGRIECAETGEPRCMRVAVIDRQNLYCVCRLGSRGMRYNVRQPRLLRKEQESAEDADQSSPHVERQWRHGGNVKYRGSV